jgi:S-adenosyl methyltransferase
MAGQVDSGGFDPKVPTEGRMNDVFLGGKDNFAADRQAALRALELAPELPVLAREGRKFLRRIMRFLAGTGVRQVLDIGVGLPTQGHLEEVGGSMPGGSRIVYGCQEPVAMLHSRAYLEHADRMAAIQADLSQPDGIFGNDDVQGLIDLAEPTVVLLLNVLHLIPDDKIATDAVDYIRKTVAPGSYIAIAHAVSDICPETTARLAALYQEEAVKGPGFRDNLRTKAEVEEFFTDLELVEPGVVYLPAWRPDPGELMAPPESIWAVGGIGRTTG